MNARDDAFAARAVELGAAEELCAELREAWQNSEAIALFHEAHPDHPAQVREECRRHADAWQADYEEARRDLERLRVRPLETPGIPRIHESEPGVRRPYFDVATLIAGTYPPESEGQDTEGDGT